jgi:ubiquitin C-terminal hydrolase
MINSNIYGNNLNINQNNNYYNNIFNNNNNNIYQNYNNNLIGNENLRNPSNEINNYYNYNLYKNDNNNLFNSKLNKDSKGNKNKDNLNHFNRSPNIRIYNNNNRKDIIYNNIFSRDKNKIDNKYKNKYNNRFLLGSGPPKGNFPMSYKTQILSNKPKLNLYQCFESFSKPEILSGENQQYCNSCNQMSNATYITTIYSTCNILILILNYGKGILFECDVDFDEYIDISKYVQQANISPVKYRLLGIIVHIGPSSMSGHFIAYCRQDNSWYKFNDSIVSNSTFNEIRNSNGIPYVFFYENTNPY